ncbi:hypothetical protein [Pedobacter roseus]|uniref:Uncharacterized protein n=1 Tax=Pedobacter roseus TaxID=336820 RepID=A0A7G9QHC5_9SPHI|nr:hypothetical protein [Pedobacter roseus]QNN42750.1 hypothetical protein H9L23_01120 [Pedobacter roseus]
MSSKNRISAVITPEQLKASADAIVAFKANLSNALTISLEAEERRRMLKMGNKTLSFVEKTLEYARHNPSLVPIFMDLEEATKDYELAASLYDIFQQLNILITAVEDAGMVAGSEAYEAALIFYHTVKGASRSSVLGSQAIYDDLSQRFPGRRKAKNVSPPQP